MEESNDNMILLVCGLALLWYLHENGYLSFGCNRDTQEHYSPVGNAPPMGHRYFTDEQYWMYYLYTLLTMQGLDSGNPVLMDSRQDNASSNSNYRAQQVVPINLSNGGTAFGPFSAYNSSSYFPDAIQNNGQTCAY